jgi:hypothetical protein
MTLPHQVRDCNESRPVPVLHMHGTSDPVVEYKWGVMSVEQWVEMNGCPQTPQVTNNYQGSSTVKKEYYGPCKDNTEVIFLSAQGMGHAWMSQSQVGVSAAVESWNFMSRYSLTPPVSTDRARVKSKNASASLIARYHAGTISLRGVNGVSSVRLADMKGRVVGEWCQPDYPCRLSTGQLTRGIYLLMVSYDTSSGSIRILVD